MKTTVIVTMLIVAMTTVGGCKSAPRAGVTGWKGTMPVGSLAKDIPITASDGTETTFHQVRGPIAIMAFTNPPPDQCCWVSPKLLNLTNRFEGLPVSVVQFSLPTGKCPHGPGCVDMCKLGKTQLFSFCDADRIAWKTYGRPTPNTVILIDQRDNVIATGSLENLTPIADKAYEMGKRLNESGPDKIYRHMWFD